MLARRCLCKALLCLMFVASFLKAGQDTQSIAGLPGTVIEGIQFAGQGQLKFKIDGKVIKLNVTQNTVVLFYADGTQLANLKLGDSVEITGELFSKGIGGKLDGHGFTLVPGLRFTVKNTGTSVIQVFDPVNNKMVDVQPGASTILEVRVDQLPSADDLAKLLKNGHLVKVGKSAVVAKVDTNLILMSFETVTLGKGNSQLTLSPDSSIVIESGRLSLRDGQLNLTGSTIIIAGLSGTVTVTSGTVKFEITPGLKSVGSDVTGFSKPFTSSNPPTGFIFLVSQANTSGTPITSGTPATNKGKPAGTLIILIVPTFNPNIVLGDTTKQIISGTSRGEVSPAH